MTIEEIVRADNDGERFQIEGYGGIAFYYHSTEIEPNVVVEWEDEEGGYFWNVEDQPTGMVLMVMVGDDAKHIIDPDDVSIIPDGEYCKECGQIGCKANA